MSVQTLQLWEGNHKLLDLFVTAPHAEIKRQEDFWGPITVVREGWARVNGHMRWLDVGPTDIPFGHFSTPDLSTKAPLEEAKAICQATPGAWIILTETRPNVFKKPF